MNSFDQLLRALKNARVLRSSCPSSHDGMFRVHLVETEWDDIVKLVEKIESEEYGWFYCEEHGHEDVGPCPDCLDRNRPFHVYSSP